MSTRSIWLVTTTQEVETFQAAALEQNSGRQSRVTTSAVLSLSAVDTMILIVNSRQFRNFSHTVGKQTEYFFKRVQPKLNGCTFSPHESSLDVF